VEILLWLVPPVVVTVLAMAWVGWVGREGRGAVDQDEAVRRLSAALERDPHRPTRLPRRRERSTGVALRRTPPAGERPGTAGGEQRRAG
jgi:hypothetical protein